MVWYPVFEAVFREKLDSGRVFLETLHCRLILILYHMSYESVPKTGVEPASLIRGENPAAPTGRATSAYCVVAYPQRDSNSR